ncbi:unnamed protein product, partial [Didymodactylos carnosus]
MSESWVFELGVLFAAKLDSARSLSAQSVAYQVGVFLFQVGQSVGVAGNVRIGQYLGAGKPVEAKSCKNIIYTLGVFIVAFDMALIFSTSRWIPLVFNIREPEALALSRHILLVVVSMEGMIKACGKQAKGAGIAFFGFYVIGIPLAAVFMFVLKIDVFGFWTGYAVGK